jgi:hypothetical protein
VLEQVSVLCVCAADLHFSDAAFRAEAFDLVLLCHTLPYIRREDLAVRVHDLSPGTPVFLIHWQRLATVVPSEVDGVLPADPGALIDAVGDYLQQRSLSAANIAAA